MTVFFSKFEQFFNQLSNDEKDEIFEAAKDKVNLCAPEDDVTSKFRNITTIFLSQFSESTAFQRGDYQELFKLVKVRKNKQLCL